MPNELEPSTFSIAASRHVPRSARIIAAGRTGGERPHNVANDNRSWCDRRAADETLGRCWRPWARTPSVIVLSVTL